MLMKVSFMKPQRTRNLITVLALCLATNLSLYASHTMSWDVINTSSMPLGGGSIQVTVTLGFCNEWCTGTNVSCCGGLHDVYVRITSIDPGTGLPSTGCATCPSNPTGEIIGPIDAGFVGPPYNGGNPQLPTCPAPFGDPNGIEVPFSFQGCPGEVYRVEILAVNRTTLARCGGIGNIPNVCTNGCRPSTETNWQLGTPNDPTFEFPLNPLFWQIPGTPPVPDIMEVGAPQSLSLIHI